MAWVQLKNLFEDDKNYYGALNGALNCIVCVQPSEFTKDKLNKKTKTEIERCQNILLKDVLDNKIIGQPEWGFGTNGKLYNYAYFNKHGFQDLLEIDIMPWISEQDEVTLKIIADSCLWTWKNRDQNGESPKFSAGKEKDKYFQRKIRDTKQQKEFFKAIETYRKAANKYTIKSYWSRETGTWNKNQREFLNREWSPTKEKTIEIEVKHDNNRKPFIQFIGGPTGYESYYLESILKDIDSKSGKLYICAGTINRWTSCWILWEDFKPILESIQKKLKTTNKESQNDPTNR